MNRERIQSVISQASELARLLMRSSQPPRKLTAEYLHGRKRATSSEKGIISSLAHHAILNWRLSAYALTGSTADIRPREDAEQASAVVPASLISLLTDSAAEDLSNVEIINAFLEAGSHPEDLLEAATRRLAECGGPLPEVLTDRIETLKGEAEASFITAAVLTSLPDWVVETWHDAGIAATPADVLLLGRSLSRPAPLTLRANTMICSRVRLLSKLREEGLQCDEHPILPDAVVMLERSTLTDSPLYESGCFEVQDAGSQLIGLACGAESKMHVYDACAGGGGKTMHLANIMRDSGSIIGSDIERNKLRGMMQRGARLGLRSLSAVAVTPSGEPFHTHDRLPEIAGQDVVLVDAPCSGFGTVRRSPTIKWKLTERTIRRLSEKQLLILKRNAAYVRPGGVLLYATCSLLPAENQAVIAAFLREHSEFSAEPLAPAFDMHHVTLPNLSDAQTQLMLHPSTLDSDGFFMARMRRSS